WITRRADGHREVEHRVVVIAERAARRKRVSELLDPSNVPWVALVRFADHSTKPAEDVAVDDRGAAAAMQREPRGARIAADPGDRAQLLVRHRHAFFVEEARRLEQRATAHVEADTISESAYRSAASFQQVTRRRVFRAKEFVRGTGLARARALEKKF